MIDRLDALYRRTGANLPTGDPLPSHGAQMEGYFWRVTDVASSRVVVVLCGVNRHPDGDWATGGSVSGQALIGNERWVFDDAEIYAEKNWGAGFPERWWWGQAQGFERPDVCVAFSGGEPHVLTVPLPADRRNIDTDFEFLAAHMTVELTGAVHYSGETELAGLETGHRPTLSQRTRESTADADRG